MEWIDGPVLEAAVMDVNKARRYLSALPPGYRERASALLSALRDDLVEVTADLKGDKPKEEKAKEEKPKDESKEEEKPEEEKTKEDTS